MKIVIVDDDCLVTEALKTILEVNEDVQVLATGSDGRDAVCLYAEYKPDVLLMDIRMKNMNGLEASSEKQSRFLRSWCLGLTDLPCTGCLPLLYHCSDHFSGSLPAGICTVSGKRYTVRTGCYAGCRCHPQNTGQRRN